MPESEILKPILKYNYSFIIYFIDTILLNFKLLI